MCVCIDRYRYVYLEYTYVHTHVHTYKLVPHQTYVLGCSQECTGPCLLCHTGYVFKSQ